MSHPKLPCRLSRNSSQLHQSPLRWSWGPAKTANHLGDTLKWTISDIFSTTQLKPYTRLATETHQAHRHLGSGHARGSQSSTIDSHHLSEVKQTRKALSQCKIWMQKRWLPSEILYFDIQKVRGCSNPIYFPSSFHFTFLFTRNTFSSHLRFTLSSQNTRKWQLTTKQVTKKSKSSCSESEVV